MDLIERGLKQIHADMQAIDAQIVDLYQKRMQLTKEEAQGRLSPKEQLFGFNKIESIDLEDGKVVFQGVNGAYSQQALLEFFGKGTKSYHVETWRDAMEAIVVKRHMRCSRLKIPRQELFPKILTCWQNMIIVLLGSRLYGPAIA